tara:strand:- start:7838 stop:9112 length:1275 start_codon:yes stop_codon:yes gene_type:complete
MANSIKDVFKSECGHLKIDSRFVKRIMQYERDFVNRSEDHIEFLGGVLLGSPPLRFHTSDRHEWFDEVIQTDDVILKNEIHALPSVNPEHKVISDVLNLSVAWVLHALFNSKDISASQKESGMMAALKILHYRFLSSLMAHYFKYEPDRRILEAVYAELNYKFSLKRYGSWAKLIEARAQDIISAGNIHRDAIAKFNDDERIQYLLSDTQGRIREVVKKMYRVFVEVAQSGSRVNTKSSTIDIDGDIHVRHLIRKHSQYKRYIHSVISEKRSFIRDDLVSIIGDGMHTMPERHLVSALEYMSDNYGYRGDRRVEELVEETVLHAFDFINANKKEFNRNLNLALLLSRLRSLYMSSRSTNPSLLKIRELALGVVEKSVKSNNSSLLAAVRTGLLLYIVLRTFTMDYYSGGGSMENAEPGLLDSLL